MTYNMLRRTKSSSLLPIVRLTNYFYPDTTGVDVKVEELGLRSDTVDVYSRSVSGRSTGSLTPPPDYEQLYQAMQLDSNFDGIGDERVRKKYACQGKRSPTLKILD
jgi:hypothetical protein